jgi:elongation factor G
MSVPIQSNHLVEMGVEPKIAANQKKMMNALQELAGDDLSFHVVTDPDSGQTIIWGMSEGHLDIKIDMLRRRHMIDVNIGAPQVAYRETITRRTEIDYTHEKQSNGTGQFARVKLIVEPGEENSGLVFESTAGRDAIPIEYLPGVERGLQSVLTSATLAGFPMVDMKVSLIDGACHESGQSETAFEIASRTAIREAIAKAGPVLLEPIMKLEIVSPEEYLQSIVSDLNSRRGQMSDTTSRGDAQAVNALVPLAHLFGYASDLHSMSQGRATYTMSFDHYEIAGSSSNMPDPDDTEPAAMALRA